MDRNTAEKLYEAFYMKVFSYAMTLTGNREDAMEITQETFYRAISTERTFRGESDGATWLCAIAKNLFADADASLRIHRVLHNLEEPYKEVFQLRVFGELSFKEIGSIFGKTETWARVTFHRARMMVKERMEKS